MRLGNMNVSDRMLSRTWTLNKCYMPSHCPQHWTSDEAIFIYLLSIIRSHLTTYTREND